MKVSGSMHHLYMYDVGGDIDISRLEKVFNKIPEFVELKYTRLTPTYIKIPSPPMHVELRKKPIDGIPYSVSVKIYSLGAITICLKREFECEFKELLRLVDEKKIKETANEIFENLLKQLKECITRTYEREKEPEDYKIYVIKKTAKAVKGVDFLHEHKKEIGALLREEEDVDVLSDEEVEKALKSTISYYKNDLAVIGYVNALLLTPMDESDLLLAMELANIQLLELRTYGKLLDKYIEEAYEDLKKILTVRTIFLRPGRLTQISRKISEMRMDITDIVGNVLNISRFTGDWYTARVYSAVSERLHLDRVQEETLRKLDTLEDFYAMALEKKSTYQMVVLEALIVLLIIFEIVVMFVGFK